MSGTFGDILRDWRGKRRFSQLDLSLAAETSARHVSFLESGRANPSRAMVLRLSDALEMPKAVANTALTAAGFAALFPSLPPDDEALAPVYAAVREMLANHAPLPGFAIDRHWNVFEANGPATVLFGVVGVDGARNMIEALLALGETDLMENWRETALLAIARLNLENARCGGDAILADYIRRLSAHPRLVEGGDDDIDYSRAVIPSVFNLNGQRLTVFSTIAEFGTVQDVAASDVRIELMFPADDVTREFFRRMAN